MLIQQVVLSLPISQDDNDCAALHHAAINGHLHVVRKLLSKEGVDVTLKAKTGEPPSVVPRVITVSGFREKYPDFSLPVQQVQCGQQITSPHVTSPYVTENWQASEVDVPALVCLAVPAVGVIGQCLIGVIGQSSSTQWSYCVDISYQRPPKLTDPYDNDTTSHDLLAVGWQQKGEVPGKGYFSAQNTCELLREVDADGPDAIGSAPWQDRSCSHALLETPDWYSPKLSDCTSVKLSVEVVLDTEKSCAHYRVKNHGDCKPGPWVLMDSDGPWADQTWASVYHPLILIRVGSGNSYNFSQMDCTIRVLDHIEDGPSGSRTQPVGAAQLGDNAGLLAASKGQFETALAIWENSNFASLRSDLDAVSQGHMLHLLASAQPSEERNRFIELVTTPEFKQLADGKQQLPLHLASDEWSVKFLLEDGLELMLNADGQQPWETVLRRTGHLFPQLLTRNIKEKRKLRVVEPKLQILHLNGCTLDLQSLDLAGCTSLTSVDGLKGCQALKRLWLSGCTSLRSVEGLEGCQALETLSLDGCTSLSSVEELEEALVTLELEILEHCRKLRSGV